MTTTMVKLGLLGVGHLGKVHLKCLQAINAIEVIGFYDPDDKVAEAIAATYPIKRFDNLFDLILHSEAVDIVTPTITHFDLAARAIQDGKHVFIEKPLTHTLAEAKDLVQLAQKHAVKVQVGYVERFNPAFLSIQNIPLNPVFIEAHRLTMFNPRGTDVSVVLDLMVHDLDLVLSLVKAPLKSVSASGVAVVSNSPDISNARLEFENGCVANLTASRISMKQMRKLRIFQKDAYISLDLLKKQSQLIRLFEVDQKASLNNENLLSLDTKEGKKYIHIDTPETQPINAIKMELAAFAKSILADTKPIVTIEEGYHTLKVAYQIMEEIIKRQKTFRAVLT